MHKSRHLLADLAALAISMTLALVLASSVAAAGVTHTILITDESEPFYACSFPLSATFSGMVRLTEIDTADSVQLLFTAVGPTTVTVTNPANGKSLTGMGQTAGEILKFSDELVRRSPERDHAELRPSRPGRRPTSDRELQLRRQHIQRSEYAWRYDRVLRLFRRPVERGIGRVEGRRSGPPLDHAADMQRTRASL